MEKYAAVILAGGGLGKELQGYVDVASKALIPVGGRPMVDWVIDALAQSPSVGDVVLAMQPEEVPPALFRKVAHVAPPGDKILDSIASGMRQLPQDVAEQGVLIIPGDCPFLTPEALEDFLAEVRRRPADFYYGYLTRQDSEKAYPGLRHTYARMKEGVLCGTGLIMMTPAVVEKARVVMNAAIAARKSPFRITGILGWSFIVKLIFRQLSVRDCEQRVSELMSCRVAAIQTRHACAGFNVDSPDQLQTARALAGETAV